MIRCMSKGRVHKKPYGKMWKLKERVTFDCGRVSVCVPVGFITDGASMPRVKKWYLLPLKVLISFIRLFIPRWHRKYEKAVVLHDYIYKGDDVAARQYVMSVMSARNHRHAADLIILHLAKGWRRKPMYWAVRLFGWIAWRN